MFLTFPLQELGQQLLSNQQPGLAKFLAPVTPPLAGAVNCFYRSGDYAQIPFTSERAAGSKQAKGILVSAVLELLREHSLTIFLVATGVGWVIAFGAMDSETK